MILSQSDINSLCILRAQRVKASQDDYAARLANHHAVIVAAMKAKQSASIETAEALKASITVLENYYPAEHVHHH